MNNSYTFVLAIVVVVMCAQLAKTYLKQRARRPEPNEELEQTMAKIDELEDRIKVLERIVTEKRYDLKSEIDSL
jgi:membrane protein implicated in regulation of membrane protease activity